MAAAASVDVLENDSSTASRIGTATSSGPASGTSTTTHDDDDDDDDVLVLMVLLVLLVRTAVTRATRGSETGTTSLRPLPATVTSRVSGALVLHAGPKYLAAGRE